MDLEFKPFNKISRLSRDCVITEKIDGTNAQILITPENSIFAGSRNRWLSDHEDNHGFWHWVMENREELLKLGEGRHFGEWWGKGVNRSYGLQEKRFSLFNTYRWSDPAVRPGCCSVVPILYTGTFKTDAVDYVLCNLKNLGSEAAPGFMNPEGIVVFHSAANIMFKKTIENDEKPKGQKND